MAVRNDTVKTTVIMDGKQAVSQLGKLEMHASELRQEIKGAKKGTDEYIAANKKLTAVKNQITGLRKEMGVTGMTLQQLTRYQRDLSREIANTTTRGTAKYKQLNAQLGQVNHQMRQQRSEMRSTAGIWNKLTASAKQFGAVALGYLGITTIISQLSRLSKKSEEYSDLLASVRKTTGLTANETDRLSKSLERFDTRTSKSLLLTMEKIAGKLGITQINELEGFANAFDKINVALGEDLGDPEAVSRSLGKILESYNITEMYGIEQALLKTGSAVNHLGKASVANEGNIVDFTRRMAGIAPLANQSLQDVMGLGATLDALGQTVEVSSTAMSKLYVKMTQNKEAFAEYAIGADGAQLSVSAFAELIDADFNEALISVLRGVKDNSAGMNDLAATLGDLGQDGGRVIGVLGSLANNIELLQEQQSLSNQEFEKGTSVLEEFNLMNETFGAKMDKIRKAVISKFVNSGLVSFLERMADGILNLLPPFEDAADRMQRLNDEFNIEMQALINGNLEHEARRDLIQDINDKYATYLPNLITESTTTAELIGLQSQMNQQMVQRILLMQQEERVAGLVQRRANAIRMQIGAEKLQAEFDLEQLGGQTMSRQYIEQRKQEIENYRKLALFEMESSTNELNEAQKEFEEIQSRFGSMFGGKKPKGPASGGSGYEYTPASSSDSETKGASIQDIMGGEISAWRDSQLSALVAMRDQELITESEYNRKLQELEISHLIAMRELAASSGESTADLDQKISDKKLQIKEDEHARIQRLREEDQAKEQQYNQQKWQGIDMMAVAVGSSLQSMSAMVTASTEQAIEKQLAFAQAQVIAQRGVALAYAIAGAAEAAKAGGPAAPFLLAGYIATSIATIMGAFGDFKNNVGQAKSSISDLNGSSSSGSNPRGFYNGGEVGAAIGSSSGDFYGKYAGVTHAGEFVEPAWIRNYPDVINAEGIMKAKMQGYSLSSPNQMTDQSMSSSSSESSDKMMAAAELMGSYIDVLVSVGITAQITDKTMRDIEERKTRIQAVKDRASISK